jgi:cyclophilin family peptidyl-prolyl cis-trans isomerase
MKPLLLLSLLLFAISCDKKTVTEIDPLHVREQLIAYGEQHGETEVLIETGLGNIRIRLYEETPLHRANFIKNIKDGVYEDPEFYRIISQFMVQGGIYPKELNYTVPAEFDPKFIHKKGALSMARGDENNPERESSPTEFFIVQGFRYLDYQVEEEAQQHGLTLTDEQRDTYMTVGGYMSLDQQYTTFGEVVEGLEVVDKIAAEKVYNEDKPLRKIPFKISVVK